MTQTFRTRFLILLLLCVEPPQAATGQPVDFNREIRPILNDHCAACHGGVKKSGGFSVISRELLLSEADSGMSPIVPGNSKQSLLFQRIVATDINDRMPPAGHDGLLSSEIDLLSRWIDEGAQWPSHWAYEPVPPLPASKTFGAQHPVDWYVARKLKEVNVEPSPPADSRTLVRRLAIDLNGLLPSDAAIEHLDESESAFGNDSAALEILIDSFLALPHYGERWGRHWLDEARYADSEGYEKDSVKEDAYRYRDWVIEAINRDMPFDDFTRAQIAGDLLPNRTHADLIATKFHLQSQFNLEGGVDSEEDRTKRVIDRISTVGSVWMASSIGCCQCHDHPYDDFRQRDFFKLYAFFNNTDMSAEFLGVVPKDAEKQRTARQKKWEALTDLLRKQLTDKNQSDRTQSLLGQLRSFDNSAGFTRYLAERKSDLRPTYVFTRGNFQRPARDAGVVEPDVPGIFETISLDGRQPTRLDLANWLVSSKNPLTARATVNKVWLHLFGRPLADQPQEFGSRGAEPTHGDLLNFLARWFTDEAKWSRRKLIRFIVTSKTYQQSSKIRSDLTAIDPDNRLLARQNRFRVEAEIVRDIVLQSSGLLSLKVGGKSVFPPLPKIVTQQTYAGSNQYKASAGENRYRRGLYTFFRRTAIDPNLSTFDCPDSSLTQAQRDRSNNPLQALVTMHNEVFHEAAQAFARTLLIADPKSDDGRLLLAFRKTVGRSPRTEEVESLRNLLNLSRMHFADSDEEATQFVGPHMAEGIPTAENAAWIAVTRVVLNLDEFLTRS